MNRMKSIIKESWPYFPQEARAFPFEKDFPESGSPGRQRFFNPPEFVLRCAAVVLIITLTALLGQVWGDPRFSTLQQNWDVPLIQQSIPLIREIFL